MKRLLQGLPLALAALWLLTSMVVLATWRGPARSVAAVPPAPSSPTTPVAPAPEPAPTELTLPTMVVLGRAPPVLKPAPRAAIVEKPKHVWRCSGWRALQSGPEDQAVRYCE